MSDLAIQVNELTRIEKIRRINRVAKIEHFLPSNPCKQQGKGRDQKQPVVRASQNRIKSNDDARIDADSRPCRAICLLKERHCVRKRSARDDFNQEDQDR